MRDYDVLIDWFKKFFSGNRKIAFFTAFIVGLLSHHLLLFLEVTNADGLLYGLCGIAGDVERSLGRWFLPVIDSLRQDVVLFSLFTLISIFLISLFVVVICELFELKSKILVFFASASIVSFPSVTGVLTYEYTSIIYSFSYLMYALAVLFAYKIKNKK